MYCLKIHQWWGNGHYYDINIFVPRAEIEAEREKISQSLKNLKEEHKEYVRKMNASIEQTEMRYGELLEEVWQNH